MGCGTGFTLIGLAALHPEGQFLGIDFMPEHVARARAFIAEAGLANIEIAEASFAELAAAPPPAAFDYVAMHGVWTWVSAENRAHLAAILGRWLAPGGVCYNGYSAAAGWQETAQIRRIFREAPQIPGRPQFEAARAAVDAWLAAGGGSETAARLWKKLAKLPDRYLAHDFGAEHASACWCPEVAAALAPAKMGFAAPADLFDQFDTLRFEPGWAEFVRRAAAEGWGETARDMASGRGFRTDLFGRGTPRIGEAQQQDLLGRIAIRDWPPLLRHETQEAEERGKRGFGPETAAKVAAALEGGPVTIGSFAARTGLPARQGLQAALLGLARREIRMVAPPEVLAARAAPVKGYLAALRSRLARGEPVPGVASPALSQVVPLGANEAAALSSSCLPEALARLGLG
nr:class I SAM-dependent methyltransferase [Mangrovicoccus sp. HB161399]